MMNDLFIVAKFTIKDMLKRKSFIISTLIILLLIVIGFNVPNIIKTFKGENAETSKIMTVDKDTIFAGLLKTLNHMDFGYEFESNDNATMEEIKQKIEKGEIEAAIYIEKDGENINVKYIVENTVLYNGVPAECMAALDYIYTQMQIRKLGLTQEEIDSLNPNFNYELAQIEEEEVSGNLFVMMLLSMALFFAIYFCAYQVSTSITTEKTSKIIETLVTSTKPATIVLGKTVGIGIVGLGQVALVIATSLISAKLFLEEGVLEQVVDISSITPFLGVIIVVYFLLGYFAYALMYALTGSTVSKPEDVQSANTPVVMILMVCFYLSYFTMMNPTSSLNVFASIFPLSSPFCMPLRVMMQIAEPKEIAISIIVLILMSYIIAKISIKIYKGAILNSGSKMGLTDIIKIYKDKNN